MTVLVLGENGQLATHLRQLLPAAQFRGRRALDLADAAAISSAISAIRPAVIVNAAGYTAVDKAESEPDLAWRINADAVAAIARTAHGLDVPLVHVSTDYVFDGCKAGEYEEADPLNPLNRYGATKAAGELAVRTLCPRAWILRASWIFSEHGTNFVKTILGLAATREEIRVVGDQRGRPTYAGDLARTIVQLLERLDAGLPYGTYHAVGGPVVSWHDFAVAIVRRAHSRGLLPKQPAVTRIATAQYPTPARRPANSALRPSPALEQRLGARFDWSVGLDSVLAAPGVAARRAPSASTTNASAP
jgi:dTDP-4-dehydrorhamnose reductase